MKKKCSDDYSYADYWGCRALPREIGFDRMKVEVPEDDPMTRWTDLKNLSRIIQSETGAYVHQKAICQWCYSGKISAKKDQETDGWLVHLNQAEHIVKLFKEYRDQYVTKNGNEESSEKPDILKLLADVASKLDEQKLASEQLKHQMKKMEEMIAHLGSERTNCIFCKREDEQ